MNRHTARGVLIALVIALAACSRQSPVAGADAGEQERPEPMSRTRAVEDGQPAKYRFAGIRNVITAPNYDELERGYTTEDRARLTAVYRGYGTGISAGGWQGVDHIFSFHSPEQLAWLLEQGFPTPDEVLAAERLDDAALEAMAKEGNFKAKAFFLERRMHGIASKEDFAALDPREMGLLVQYASQLPYEGGVFGTYVSARFANTQGDRDGALAALMFARDLGDVRAMEFVEVQRRRYPEMTATGALYAYQAMLARASHNPALDGSRSRMLRKKYPMPRSG